MNLLEKKIGSAVLKMIRTRRNAGSSSEADLRAHSSVTVGPAKLREALFSDFHAVAELKQRGGLNADSFENWERLWRRNPALALNELNGIAHPIGWILEAEGRVVGYLGNISLLYRYGGKTLTAVTAHGLVVDPPYRAMSLTLVAAFFRQKNVDLFISTSAIEAVGKIALAFKSSAVTQLDYDTALFWVLRPYSFARVLMHKLQVAAPLAQVGCIVTALAVGTDKIVRRRWPKRVPTSFTMTEVGIAGIGDDFQILWNEKQKEAPRLLADRDPATLRWHFEIPGDRGDARMICCYEHQHLIGYAMVRSDTNEEDGQQKSIIADLVARGDNPEVVRALWAAAYDYARRSGSDTLEVLGFPPRVRNAVSEWNPHRRKYPACPFFYKAADPLLHKALADGAAWYASPFDGDATLIRPSYSTSTVPLAQGQMRIEDTTSDVVPNIFGHEQTEVV